MYVTCIFVNKRQGTAACDGTGTSKKVPTGNQGYSLPLLEYDRQSEGEYGEKSDSFAAPGEVQSVIGNGLLQHLPYLYRFGLLKRGFLPTNVKMFLLLPLVHPREVP